MGLGSWRLHWRACSRRRALNTFVCVRVSLHLFWLPVFLQCVVTPFLGYRTAYPYWGYRSAYWGGSPGYWGYRTAYAAYPAYSGVLGPIGADGEFGAFMQGSVGRAYYCSGVRTAYYDVSSRQASYGSGIRRATYDVGAEGPGERRTGRVCAERHIAVARLSWLGALAAEGTLVHERK